MKRSIIRCVATSRPDSSCALESNPIDGSNQAGSVDPTTGGLFFTGETRIAPDKIRAYLATQYRIGSEGAPIVLTIGSRSDPLAALFADRRVACGAFITTFNPRGTLQSDAANDLAHGHLADPLADHDVEIIEGAGSEDGSDRPAKRSWFAPGLSLDAARAIGIRFDQDAIVWADRDAVPQLVLLR